VTVESLRTLVQIHGALAWVSLAALAAAVFAVWRRRPRGALLVALAASLGVATFVTGAMMHLPFQVKLRQRLFLASVTLGWLFERKEHAAFGALALSLGGVLALWASRLAERGGGEAAKAAPELRRAGALALSAALAFEVLALAVSMAASRRVAF
jgi:hypothetical protein